MLQACCAVLCCAALCCAAPCCDALRRAALRCAALRCAALRCAAQPSLWAGGREQTAAACSHRPCTGFPAMCGLPACSQAQPGPQGKGGQRRCTWPSGLAVHLPAAASLSHALPGLSALLPAA